MACANFRIGHQNNIFDVFLNDGKRECARFGCAQPVGDGFGQWNPDAFARAEGQQRIVALLRLHAEDANARANRMGRDGAA